ncbi:MAG: hypothetical protein ABI823_13525 [Bryobacteraceae bacterium]
MKAAFFFGAVVPLWILVRFLIVLAVLAMLGGLGGLGYLWFGVMHWDSMPGQLGFGAVGIAYGAVFSALLPRLNGPSANRLSRADRGRIDRQRGEAAMEWQERKARRIAALKANAATKKYAEMAEKGDLITDFEIAYLENPHMLLACSHFREIEHAMRTSGVRVRPKMKYTGEFANVLDCSVAILYDQLVQKFALPTDHVYTDFEDNHGGDGAFLRCQQCGFAFNTDYLRADSTRIFPRPDSWQDAYVPYR